MSRDSARQHEHGGRYWRTIDASAFGFRHANINRSIGQALEVIEAHVGRAVRPVSVSVSTGNGCVFVTVIAEPVEA